MKPCNITRSFFELPGGTICFFFPEAMQNSQVVGVETMQKSQSIFEKPDDTYNNIILSCGLPIHQVSFNSGGWGHAKKF